MPVSGATSEAIVIGAGLIGLAVADALYRRGVRVALVGDRRAGEASPAAAGMLAPTVEPIAGPALDFAVAARDRYPDWLRDLESRTGIAVSLNRNGILELAHSEERAEVLRAGIASDGDTHWLEPAAVKRLEPALAPVAGAVLHPRDGAVDNVALLDVLERAIAGSAGVARYPTTAVALERGAARAAVGLATGERLEAPVIVLAAGAWSAGIAGLPRALPIEPARGQMIALDARVLHHVVFSEHAYLVPRAGSTLAGATMERVGFDATTTAEALDTLRARAGEIASSLRGAGVAASWAGLRPMTPDGLPIIGADPEWPMLLYAAGHSRNGILMAPVTGDVIAALAGGEEPSFDLSPFDVRRFVTSRATRPDSD